MICLDLYCGAGGGAVGYARAGYEMVGVDHRPQPHYPFTFVQGDVIDILKKGALWRGVSFIHASPPCQGYSTQTRDRTKHRRLVAATRLFLQRTSLPYVMENVAGAPLRNPVRLCGSSFGLDLRRHRYFESNVALEGKPCAHAWQTPRFRSLDMTMVRQGRLASVVGVHGHINYPGEFELRCKAMGIDWMTNDELVEAIPPAYTEYIGLQMRQLV